jgi:hypothetical protein
VISQLGWTISPPTRPPNPAITRTCAVTYEQTISDVSKGVELVGIAVLIAGGLYSLITFAAALANRRTNRRIRGTAKDTRSLDPDRTGDPRRG